MIEMSKEETDMKNKRYMLFHAPSGTAVGYDVIEHVDGELDRSTRYVLKLDAGNVWWAPSADVAFHAKYRPCKEWDFGHDFPHHSFPSHHLVVVEEDGETYKKLNFPADPEPTSAHGVSGCPEDPGEIAARIRRALGFERDACARCGGPLKTFMKDMDGTNLEEVHGCPRCDS
jgi:hypothetical protein